MVAEELSSPHPQLSEQGCACVGPLLARFVKNGKLVCTESKCTGNVSGRVDSGHSQGREIKATARPVFLPPETHTLYVGGAYVPRRGGSTLVARSVHSNDGRRCEQQEGRGRDAEGHSSASHGGEAHVEEMDTDTNTRRARCTGDDESAPKTRDSTRRRCTARSRRHVDQRACIRRHRPPRVTARGPKTGAAVCV